MLTDLIQKIVANHVDKFILDISNVYKIPKDELYLRWNGEKPLLSESQKNSLLKKIEYKNPIEEPSIITFTFDELNKKKMSELKELCEKAGVKRSGNKSELIKNLLEKENKKQFEKKSVLPLDGSDSFLDVYVANSNKQKRSDFEEQKEFEIDEEGFPFHDDLNKYDSDEEGTIEDEDNDDVSEASIDDGEDDDL